MTPEEKLDLIAEWHNAWGDRDLENLDAATIWSELYDLLYPKDARAPLAVVPDFLATPDTPKAPLPGRWHE